MEYDFLPWDLAMDRKFCKKILPKWVSQGVSGWIWLTSYPCNEAFQPDFPEMDDELWNMSQAKIRDAEFEQVWYELETPEGI